MPVPTLRRGAVPGPVWRGAGSPGACSTPICARRPRRWRPGSSTRSWRSKMSARARAVAAQLAETVHPGPFKRAAAEHPRRPRRSSSACGLDADMARFDVIELATPGLLRPRHYRAPRAGPRRRDRVDPLLVAWIEPRAYDLQRVAIHDVQVQRRRVVGEARQLTSGGAAVVPHRAGRRGRPPRGRSSGNPDRPTPLPLRARR